MIYSTTHHIVIDEGASIGILSTIPWKSLSCPKLVPSLSQLLAFNRSSSEPLGVLPQNPITLGGKTVFIDIMFVEGPLELNMLLVHNYIYAMKVFVSTHFQVIHFPHIGNIITNDQLSFTNNCTTFAHPISLSVPNVQAIFSPPHAYYVATHAI